MLQLFRWAVTSLAQSFNSTKSATFGFSELAPQAPPRREAKLQNDIVFFLCSLKNLARRTCLRLRKRPWLRHRSPRLQHGMITNVTYVLFIKFYDRNVAIFQKKIRVNSTKKSWAANFRTLRWKTTQQKLAVLRDFVYSHNFFQDIQDISQEILSQLQKTLLFN